MPRKILRHIHMRMDADYLLKKTFEKLTHNNLKLKYNIRVMHI